MWNVNIEIFLDNFRYKLNFLLEKMSNGKWQCVLNGSVLGDELSCHKALGCKLRFHGMIGRALVD